MINEYMYPNLQRRVKRIPGIRLAEHLADLEWIYSHKSGGVYLNSSWEEDVFHFLY